MKNVTAVNANNWQVGKHYIQTLPKALRFIGIEDEKLLNAYNESLEAFKQCIDVRRLPAGDFEIATVNGKLYSRNIDRLKMINAKKEPGKKAFGGNKV